MHIKELLQSTEFENLQCDYKARLERKNPVSWAKSLVAFANCGGGMILDGVNNDGTIVGFEYQIVDGEKNLVNETIDRLVRPGIFRYSFHPIEFERGRYILIIHIPDALEITYLRQGDYREVIYVRHDGQSVPASVSEMAVLFRKKATMFFDGESTSIPFESTKFMSLEKRMKESGKANDSVDLSLAKSLNLADQSGNLTNCGLLFSDGCKLANANIHMRSWKGETKGEALVLDDKEFTGSLLDQYDEAMRFIALNTPSGYLKKYGGHEEIMHYPRPALHEALVNALAHRDYLIDGSQIDIDVFPSRIEIGVPGSFLVQGEKSSGKLVRMHSERRNRLICNVFTFLGMMEKSGQGFQTIIDSYKEYGDDFIPTYLNYPEYYQLTLFNVSPGVKPSEEARQDAVSHPLANQISPDERRILLGCLDSPKSASELLPLTRYKSKVSLLNNIIKPLLSKGLLVKTSKGNSPTTKYYADESKISLQDLNHKN